MKSLTTAFGAIALSLIGSPALAQSTELFPGMEGMHASAVSNELNGAASVMPFTLGLGLLRSEGLAEPDSANANDWRVDFHTWTWLLGIEGDIGARGRVADVSADFFDVLDASDSLLAFSGHLEIARGRWGVFIDGIYAKLGADDQSGPLGLADIDVTFDLAVVDFGLMYRIGDWEPTGGSAGNRRSITLDLYAGGRYTHLDLEVDPANLASRSADEEWLDPIIGAKLVLPFAEDWHVMANGDVGGFGVESDFTWSATGVVGYDFAIFEHPATVYFGYRAIGQDFSEGSGSDEFTWDVVLHGPILGFSLAF